MQLLDFYLFTLTVYVCVCVCVWGGGATSNPTRKVKTALKVVTISAGVTNALLASYDVKLVAYYS